MRNEEWNSLRHGTTLGEWQRHSQGVANADWDKYKPQATPDTSLREGGLCGFAKDRSIRKTRDFSFPQGASGANAGCIGEYCNAAGAEKIRFTYTTLPLRRRAAPFPNW